MAVSAEEGTARQTEEKGVALPLGGLIASVRRNVLSDNPLPQDAFRSRPVSDEDKYFQKREQEILEDLTDSRRARASSERLCPCPECGGTVLDRVQQDNVEIDRCPKCHGIWLDAGELELLMGHSKGAPNAITKFFRNLGGDYSV